MSNLISLKHIYYRHIQIYFRQSHQLEVERIANKSIRTYRNGTSIAYSSLSKYLINQYLCASLIIIFNFTEISSNGSNIAVIVSTLGCNCITNRWWLVNSNRIFIICSSVFKDISFKFEKEKNKQFMQKIIIIFLIWEKLLKLDLIKIKNLSLRFENKNLFSRI